MTPPRQPAHRRNPRLEQLLAQLNAHLEPVARAVGEERNAPVRPCVLIVGCPRSGTTLLMQWLAALGAFAYPSNLIARFWGAPHVGALVQRLIADPAFAFGDELAGLVGTDGVATGSTATDGAATDGNGDGAGGDGVATGSNDDGADDDGASGGYVSRLGKTRGYAAPSEFWYFWRRFFPVGDVQVLDTTRMAPDAGDRFRSELAAWEAVENRPLALKALYLNWDLPSLAALLPRSLFVHVRRQPLPTMQSLLFARREYFGADDAWYSFRPPEYAGLADRPVAEQLAGQVHFTERAVASGLASLPAGRVLTVSYEEFCRAPAAVYDALRQRLDAQGYALPAGYRGPEAFEPRQELRLSPAEIAALERAHAALAGAAV